MNYFRNKNSIIPGLLLIVAIGLVNQCAWFKSEPAEPNLVKPTPVNGYDELGTNIYYPKELRDKGIEGTVLVNASVSSEGLVTETRITQTLEPKLDRIAANAVQRTLFNPALRDGKPVDVWIAIPIQFTLKDQDQGKTPFETFKMIVKPNSSFQGFKVEMHGRLKPNAVLPMRFELLLPYNVEKVWLKSGDKTTQPLTVKDENGEWLVFQTDTTDLNLGFNYQPLGSVDKNKFSYKFSLNHAIPDWSLVIIYGDQSVQFVQPPDRTLDNPDGTRQFAYDLDQLNAYEVKYLEVALIQ
ncbi:MAG: energy transducer TonB [Candidatus Marinimicrobia bacterium]|nr:energy transducer TonB [Candidatus Neomarinimicrobiota bacterium]